MKLYKYSFSTDFYEKRNITNESSDQEGFIIEVSNRSCFRILDKDNIFEYTNIKEFQKEFQVYEPRNFVIKEIKTNFSQYSYIAKIDATYEKHVEKGKLGVLYLEKTQ